MDFRTLNRSFKVSMKTTFLVNAGGGPSLFMSWVVRSNSRLRKKHFLPRKCPSKFPPGQSWSATLAEGPFFLTPAGKIQAAGRVRLVFWKQKTGSGSTLQGLGKWLGPSFVHHNGRTANFSKGWIFTHDLLAQWNLWTRKIENMKTWNVWKSTPFLTKNL